MPEENIKRYTIEQIREMNRRGEVVQPGPNTPEFEMEEDFWEHARPVSDFVDDDKEDVLLKLEPKTVEYFRRAGDDHRKRMAEALDEIAKKAS